ncbi:MAG: hypothetical protein ACPGQL_03515 [Thermoplasmatota archaeon]
MKEPLEVTKKVRMSRDRAQRLAALAKKAGVTESEAMRQGITLLERELERKEGLDALLAMIDPGDSYVKDRLVFQ